MPLVGPYYFTLLVGNEGVVSPENFRQLFQTFDQALEYIEDVGISAQYWAIVLQQGAPRKTRNPFTGRQRITLGESAKRRQTGRNWNRASQATRERLLRYGRDQGASPQQVRAYYNSGKSLAALKPTRQAILDDPGRWEPYIRSHPRQVNRWLGTPDGAAAMQAMAQSQRSGRTAAGFGVYIQSGQGH